MTFLDALLETLPEATMWLAVALLPLVTVGLFARWRKWGGGPGRALPKVPR